MIDIKKLNLVAKERGISKDRLIAQIVNAKLDDVDRLGIKEGIFAAQLAFLTGADKSRIFYTILRNKPQKPILACHQIAALVPNLTINEDLEVAWVGYKIGKIATSNRTFENIILQLVDILNNVRA